MSISVITRERVTFAGVNFSATVHENRFSSDGKLTKVPRPVLLKILRGGKVCCECAYYYTDDYAGDAANNYARGAVPAESVAEDVERFASSRAYYEPAGPRNERHCGEAIIIDKPVRLRVIIHSNLVYNVVEL